MSLLRSMGACLLALLIAGCISIPAPASADVGVSFGFFYSNLGSQGQWLVSGDYGRVWQPAEYRPDWNPYYDGHWIYTDLGWSWVSDYEWGAIPYHYGTWVVDADLGWVWVPGYVWAPAWVIFSTGPDYIGWAPVPVGYSIGMSIGSAPYSADRFVVVASRDFTAPRVRGYALPVSRNRVVINNTRIENTIQIENNVVVNRGPDVSIVQRASGRRIESVPIERVPRASAARQVSRDDLRVDAAGSGTRLRAAEPISEKDSEAIAGRGQDDTRDRGHARGRDDSRNREVGTPRPAEPEPGVQRPDPRPAPGVDRQVPDERRARPNRPRRPDEMSDPERGVSDGSKADTGADDKASADARAKADADAKAKADARAKADAKAKADAREKAHKKKEKPKPPPADDKPPHD